MIHIIPRDEKSIWLKSPYDPATIKTIKNNLKGKWLTSKKRWLIFLEKETIHKIQTLFQGKLFIDPLFFLQELKRELSIRRYSRKTVKSYLHHNRQLLLFANKKPDIITQEDIKKYIHYKLENREIATATINQMINAFRFFFGKCLQKHFIYDVKRPKKDKTLPKILSQAEIKKIFNSVENMKHKAILMLTYSAGLRVSEVVKLKVEDIDSTRKTVFIKGGKGRKDRISLLSEKMITQLRKYYQEYRPAHFLFPGYDKNKALSIRSVQNIFSHTLQKSDITKKVGIHSLRHSFATHLLEQGVNLRYIQELLGHKSPKTTQIYTYVSNQEISKIKNPLDNFDI